MSNKKKHEKIGIIRSNDLLKSSRPRQDIPFRTGWDRTEKDRPRVKTKPRDVAEEDLL